MIGSLAYDPIYSAFVFHSPLNSHHVGGYYAEFEKAPIDKANVQMKSFLDQLSKARNNKQKETLLSSQVLKNIHKINCWSTTEMGNTWLNVARFNQKISYL